MQFRSTTYSTWINAILIINVNDLPTAAHFQRRNTVVQGCSSVGRSCWNARHWIGKTANTKVKWCNVSFRRNFTTNIRNATARTCYRNRRRNSTGSCPTTDKRVGRSRRIFTTLNDTYRFCIYTVRFTSNCSFKMKTNRVPATKATRLASYTTDDPLTFDTDVVLYFLFDAANYEISISKEDVCGGREMGENAKHSGRGYKIFELSSFLLIVISE